MRQLDTILCPKCRILSGVNPECPLCHGTEQVRLFRKSALIAFKIQPEIKELLYDIATEKEISVGRLCRDILTKFLKEKFK